MNSPAFFSLGNHAYCEMQSRKEAVLPEGEEPRWQDPHLTLEQRAQPIDCVGACILADSTVDPPVSAELGGFLAAMLAKQIELNGRRSRGTSKSRSGLPQQVAFNFRSQFGELAAIRIWAGRIQKGSDAGWANVVAVYTDEQVVARVLMEGARTDVLAGVPLAGLLIPEGIAYAGIAAVPPQMSLYSALAGMLVYAIFGTSRQLAITSTSSSPAMLAALAEPIALGDSACYMMLMSAVTVAAGLFFLLGGALKLGIVSEFISKPVDRFEPKRFFNAVAR